jgi:hypothetical protein
MNNGTWQTYNIGCTEYTVTIIKGQVITVKAVSPNKITCFSYHIGDWAEYDSYNLHYFGEITSITEKTVTIKKGIGKGSRRLKIADFAWRNGNKSISEKQLANQDTMNYI